MKPAEEAPKKKTTEIPLILAPSHAESDANPWLTTSAVLPASEYSKPAEVRNEETSSSSESEEEEEAEAEVVQPPAANESYGLTTTATKVPEQLNMPTITKRVDIEPEKTEEHQMNIQEAFADDDVLAEFEKEKADTVERDQPKAIDLSLPGWGEWAGTGVPINKRKKRKYVIANVFFVFHFRCYLCISRFLIQPKPAPARRDVHLQHVIINEKVNEKISAHRVCTLLSSTLLLLFSEISGQ